MIYREHGRELYFCIEQGVTCAKTTCSQSNGTNYGEYDKYRYRAIMNGESDSLRITVAKVLKLY